MRRKQDCEFDSQTDLCPSMNEFGAAYHLCGLHPMLGDAHIVKPEPIHRRSCLCRQILDSGATCPPRSRAIQARNMLDRPGSIAAANEPPPQRFTSPPGEAAVSGLRLHRFARCARAFPQKSGGAAILSGSSWLTELSLPVAQSATKMTMTHLLQWRRMRQERIAALLYYFEIGRAHV